MVHQQRRHHAGPGSSGPLARPRPAPSRRRAPTTPARSCAMVWPSCPRSIHSTPCATPPNSLRCSPAGGGRPSTPPAWAAPPGSRSPPPPGPPSNRPEPTSPRPSSVRSASAWTSPPTARSCDRAAELTSHQSGRRLRRCAGHGPGLPLRSARRGQAGSPEALLPMKTPSEVTARSVRRDYGA